MENLEKQCLDRLNKILSKFDLKIEIVNIASLHVRQYRLVDDSLYKNPYSDWLCLWLSISEILINHYSIFECLNSYHILLTNNHNMSTETRITYQRYSKAYNTIKYLENISCLEEFIIKYDLMEA